MPVTAARPFGLFGAAGYERVYGKNKVIDGAVPSHVFIHGSTQQAGLTIKWVQDRLPSQECAASKQTKLLRAAEAGAL
jgi:hypothetical protein